MRSGASTNCCGWRGPTSTIHTAVLEARLSVRRPCSMRSWKSAIATRSVPAGAQVHRQQAGRTGCPACLGRRKSRYLVEPDVKDGKGGLRDLHTLFWIGKFSTRRRPRGWPRKGASLRGEFRGFKKCEDFLWAVRCHLHFLRGRAEDRLTFDIQREIAQRLGYTSHGGLRACRALHEALFPRRQGCRRPDADLLRGLEARQMKERRACAVLPAFCRRSASGRSATMPDFRLDAGRLTSPTMRFLRAIRSISSACLHVADDNGTRIHPDASSWRGGRCG